MVVLPQSQQKNADIKKEGGEARKMESVQQHRQTSKRERDRLRERKREREREWEVGLFKRNTTGAVTPQ